ncbi:MAG: hypothetical protein ACRD29_00230 [Acidimicrobiales bacterium]
MNRTMWKGISVVPDPPWRAAPAPSDAGCEVTVVRERRMDAPGERAVAVVQHLGSLPVWERKARHVTVTPSGPAHGTYAAYGRIIGLLLWRAHFDYELTELGFHSWMPAPVHGMQVAGGFLVTTHSPHTCTVLHYEQYRFPFRSRVIAAAWRRYVARGMDAELERIAQLSSPGPGRAASAHQEHSGHADLVGVSYMRSKRERAAPYRRFLVAARARQIARRPTSRTPIS